MRRSLLLGVMVLACVFPARTIAQDKPAEKSAAAPSSGPRAEFLVELKGEEQKFTRLAEATPADKFTWRPGPDVRSIAEVYLHVAAANYNLTKLIGTPPPEGFQAKGFDKSTTDKAKVIQTLQDSFTHMREAVIKMPDADLDKQLDWFGGSKNTQRGILLFIMRHMGEHLGQSIAYARMNGIVPPWTEDQQKAKPEAKPKQ